MMSVRMNLLLFTLAVVGFFVVSVVEAQNSNVCTRKENYIEVIYEPKDILVTHKGGEKCWNLSWDSFMWCPTEWIETRTIDIPKNVTRERIITQCCQDYYKLRTDKPCGPKCEKRGGECINNWCIECGKPRRARSTGSV